jgi:hypothetical protein
MASPFTFFYRRNEVYEDSSLLSLFVDEILVRFLTLLQGVRCSRTRETPVIDSDGSAKLYAATRRTKFMVISILETTVPWLFYKTE